MSEDKEKHTDGGSAGHENPSDSAFKEASIVGAIHSVAKEQKTAHEKTAKQQDDSHGIHKSAARVAKIYAGITALIFVASVCGLYLTGESNRVNRDALREAQADTKILENQLSAQATTPLELLKIQERAALTSKRWKLVNFGENLSPVASFVLQNTGHTHAHVLQATIEYAVTKDLPVAFGPSVPLPSVPALLGPNSDNLVVISGLPTVGSADAVEIGSGSKFIYMRVIIYYLDIFTVLQDIRITAKYGQFTGKNGSVEPGFQFPEIPVPESKWRMDATTLRSWRCYNFAETYGQYDACDQGSNKPPAK